jgi:hypothetical protein
VADGARVCDPDAQDTPPANRSWLADFDVDGRDGAAPWPPAVAHQFAGRHVRAPGALTHIGGTIGAPSF